MLDDRQYTCIEIQSRKRFMKYMLKVKGIYMVENFIT